MYTVPELFCLFGGMGVRVVERGRERSLVNFCVMKEAYLDREGREGS